MNGESRPPAGRAASSKGGAEGTRTPDPHTASVVRYQLRHSPLPTRSGPSEPWTTIQGRGPGPGRWKPMGGGGPGGAGGWRRRRVVATPGRGRSALLHLGDAEVVAEGVAEA